VTHIERCHLDRCESFCLAQYRSVGRCPSGSENRHRVPRTSRCVRMVRRLACPDLTSRTEAFCRSKSDESRYRRWNPVTYTGWTLVLKAWCQITRCR